ncbi:MAG: ATP-binding protein, partial [Dehalococcoidales bacterium]
RVVFEGEEFKKDDFKVTKWRQSAEIKVHGKRAGTVEACYLEEKPESDEGPFLKEERDLIEGLAQRLGDIVERRRAEEKERQQNEFLNIVMESLTHPFYVIDASDYTVKMANEAAHMGDLSGNPTCYALIHKSSKPCEGGERHCPLREVQTTKTPVSVEHIHYDEDGNARNIAVHCYPIFDNSGNVKQVIEYCLDITERKRAEVVLRGYSDRLKEEVDESTRQLQKALEEVKVASRHKSQFLVNMSHELRTPLNSIIGYTKLIHDGLDGDINEEQKRDLHIIYTNSKYLLELITDLLDLSRIEAGKIVVNYEPFPISELLAEVIPGIDQLAGEKGLNLTYSIDPDIRDIYADKAKTRQTLINLLNNAVKFTNKGSVDLSIVETNSDFVFSVTDTGIGIKEEDLERIFDSFNRSEAAHMIDYEGAGLGLAISKRLTEIQGGRIWAESELDKGTSFIFTLPKKKVNGP